MKFTLNTRAARLSRLETTAVKWLATVCKFKGEVVVTRRSSKLFDFNVKWVESKFKLNLGSEAELWFPIACRDQWLGTKWAKHFAQPDNDFAFVREADVKTVWKDFHAVVAAAFLKESQ